MGGFCDISCHFKAGWTNAATHKKFNMTHVAKCIDRSKLAVLKPKMTPRFVLTLADCELGSETSAGWSMHIGGTQMASVMNMDEGSDTTTQTDSVEGKESER